MQLGFNCSDSIHNPFADFRVPVLPHRKVVFTCRDESAWRIYGTFVKDGVDSHNEEVGEGGEEGLVSIEDGS